MKVRNYWGVEGGWTGEWCNNHEDWDRNPEIRKALLPDQRNKMKDDHIQFFMTLNDWTKEFNNWCICKVFNGNWQNYSIPGEWVGKTAGGRSRNS
jgi:Calpain family cysteine protease